MENLMNKAKTSIMVYQDGESFINWGHDTF